MKMSLQFLQYFTRIKQLMKLRNVWKSYNHLFCISAQKYHVYSRTNNSQTIAWKWSIWFDEISIMYTSKLYFSNGSCLIRNCHSFFIAVHKSVQSFCKNRLSKLITYTMYNYCSLNVLDKFLQNSAQKIIRHYIIRFFENSFKNIPLRKSNKHVRTNTDLD